MTTEREDIPKIVASVMVAIPGLGIKTGLIYLRTKRKLHKTAKVVMKGMIDGGLPEDMARSLANKYEENLSVRNLLNSMNFFKG